ncbi:MAG: hypothetical protein ACYDGM_05570, partial [Vulcanimicrobiaceae bacterium]
MEAIEGEIEAVRYYAKDEFQARVLLRPTDDRPESLWLTGRLHVKPMPGMTALANAVPSQQRQGAYEARDPILLAMPRSQPQMTRFTDAAFKYSSPRDKEA